MGRPKKQDKAEVISATVYPKHLRMLTALKNEGLYPGVSEIVRHGIEKIYEENIKDSEEDLLLEKARLEKVVSSLEEIQRNKKSKITGLLDRYIERKKMMAPRGMLYYEEYSRKWIEANIDEARDVYPNKSIDEIYFELEKAMRDKNGSD